MQPLVGGFAIFCEGCFYVMGYVLSGKLPCVRTAYVLIFCLYFFFPELRKCMLFVMIGIQVIF